MAKLSVERIGGIAGFGGAKSHIRSHGEIDLDSLSTADQQAVEGLFQLKGAAQTQTRDAFLYRISRTTSKGTETVDASEEVVPGPLRHCVKDELV